MLKKWKTLSKKYAFDHKWFKVIQETVERDDGVVIDDYFLWENVDVVVVVAQTIEGELVLVKQYKHGVQDIVIEFAAGAIDKDEDPLSASKRELREEAGYTSDDWQKLGDLYNDPSKVRGKIEVFLALNAKKTHAQSFDENENIEVLLKSSAEIERMIVSGEIWVTGIIGAFYLAKQKLTQIQK